MAEFEEAIRAGKTNARQELIADLALAKGPLIESLGGGELLVTFVYVGRGDSVTLQCQLADVNRHPDEALYGSEGGIRMRPAEGTDVWWVSLTTFETDLSIEYTFRVDVPPIVVGADVLHIAVTDPDRAKDFYGTMYRNGHRDIHNPDLLALEISYYFDEPDGTVTYPFSVLTLPDADHNTWFGQARGEAGHLSRYTFDSSVFKDRRTLSVYTPPGHDVDSAPCPVLMIFDGEMHLSCGFDEILTNMINAGAIPPVVAVFMHNPTAMARFTELPCNPLMIDYCADEVLPYVRSNYAVSHRAEETIIAGASFGGLASSWVALNRSDLFGNVLSMSGSYWWGWDATYPPDMGPDPDGRDVDGEWLTRQITLKGRLPVKWWLDAGSLESQATMENGASLLASNERLRDVLQDQGSEVKFHQFSGGHFWAGWRRTFPLGLQYLLGPAT